MTIGVSWYVSLCEGLARIRESVQTATSGRTAAILSSWELATAASIFFLTLTPYCFYPAASFSVPLRVADGDSSPDVATFMSIWCLDSVPGLLMSIDAHTQHMQTQVVCCTGRLSERPPHCTGGRAEPVLGPLQFPTFLAYCVCVSLLWKGRICIWSSGWFPELWGVSDPLALLPYVTLVSQAGRVTLNTEDLGREEVFLSELPSCFARFSATPSFFCCFLFGHLSGCWPWGSSPQGCRGPRAQDCMSLSGRLWFCLHHVRPPFENPP